MYRDTNRKNRRNLILATLAVLLIIAIDFFTHGAIRAPIRSLTLTLWSGIHRMVSGISASGFFSSRGQLARENHELKEQIESMQAQIASARASATHIKDLEAAAHLATEIGGITAPVISSAQASPYSTFYIGAGEKNGVYRGALVLSLDGFAIGKVVETTPNTSLVKELFAPGETIEGLIAEKPITLTGKGGGNAEGKFPRGTLVSAGTYIFDRTDRTRALGLVGHTEGGPTSPSLTVYARVSANLETMRYVFVKL